MFEELYELDQDYAAIWEEDIMIEQFTEDYLDEVEEVPEGFWIQFEIILTQYDDQDELTENDLQTIEALLNEIEGAFEEVDMEQEELTPSRGHRRMLNAKKNKCKDKGPMKGKMGKFNEHKEGKRGKGGDGKHGPGGRKGPCGKKFGRRGPKVKCIVKAVLFMIAAVWGATNFPAYFTFFYFLRKDVIRVHQLKQV